MSEWIKDLMNERAIEWMKEWNLFYSLSDENINVTKMKMYQFGVKNIVKMMVNNKNSSNDWIYWTIG